MVFHDVHDDADDDDDDDDDGDDDADDKDDDDVCGHLRISRSSVFLSPRLRLALKCFRDIPECNNDVQLQCAVHDVWHAGDIEVLVHRGSFFL